MCLIESILMKSNHSIKSKCLKWIVKKIMPKILGTKNTKSKIKLIKSGKEIRTTYCLGFKDYTESFNPQEVKISL